MGCRLLGAWVWKVLKVLKQAPRAGLPASPSLLPLPLPGTAVPVGASCLVAPFLLIITVPIASTALLCTLAQALYNETDKVTGGWLSHASALLAACTAQLGGGSIACAADGTADGSAPLEVVHVAVTSGQLIPSLAKLLLFRLGEHIPAEHVWSSRFVGKLRCFQRVAERFGPHCTYVAIGECRRSRRGCLCGVCECVEGCVPVCVCVFVFW